MRPVFSPSSLSISLLACSLAAATALGCNTERNPPRPGGGFGGGTGGNGQRGPDARTDTPDADGALTVSGRLCLLRDLRDPLDCADADLTGLRVTVQETGASQETDDVGDYSVVVPDGVRAVIEVTQGSNVAVQVVPSVIPIPLDQAPLAGVALQALDADEFQRLLDQIPAPFTEGNAHLAVHIFDGGVPVAGATITDIIAESGPFYDNATDPSRWGVAPTEDFGAAVLFGVNPIETELRIIAPDASSFSVSELPLVPDAITFAEVEIGQ